MTAQTDMLAQRFVGFNLGTRLVFWLVMSSTLLSLVASGLQLYISYQRDVSETQEVFDIFEQSFYSSLTSALWEFNFNQIEIILDGLAANKAIAAIDLHSSTGQSFIKRSGGAGDSKITKSIALTRIAPDGTEVHLGDLQIGISLAHVHERLWSQFWTLLVTNMVKTTIASFIMLGIFYLLVSRHLRQIASFVQTFDLATPSAKLRLNRKAPAVTDDLDFVVSAINGTQQRLHNAYEDTVAVNRSLDQSNLELQRSNDELQNFAYVAAHDLQEPLRKIKAFGSLLSDECRETLNSDGREYVGFMVEASSRLQTLVKDLLIYSRVGAPVGEFRDVDLNETLQATIEDLSLSLEAIDGSIEVGDLPTVIADRSQMKQLFLNVVGNAIKYHSPDRPLRIVVRGTVSAGIDDADPHAKYCEVHVEDNGIGFDQEHAPMIFEPFKRLHTKEAYEGTGVGLAIAKKIVFHHGGRITAKGRAGVGALFSIVLPVAAPK